MAADATVSAGVTDMVEGAESDSGRQACVACPQCGQSHWVAVSTIGRFAYVCEGFVVTSRLGCWRQRRGLLAQRGGAQQS